MKHLTTIILLLLSTSALSQTQAVNKNAEQTVMQMERNLQKAIMAGDRTTFAALLSDDYTAVLASGVTRNKQEAINRLQPSPSETRDSIMSVRFYGNTAVLNGLWITRVRESSQPPVYIRRMSVWVQQNDTWKLAASQGTRIPLWNVRPLEDGEMEPLTALTCTEEQKVKSQLAETPTFIRFRNNTSGDIYAYWIDYAGKRAQREPHTIPIHPGKVYETNTFVTHPFVVTDAAGKCLGIYQPTTKPGVVVIGNK